MFLSVCAWVCVCVYFKKTDYNFKVSISHPNISSPNIIMLSRRTGIKRGVGENMRRMTGKGRGNGRERDRNKAKSFNPLFNI